MTESELLSRIDQHLARADEHMARGNELMGAVRTEMARGHEVVTRFSELHEDLRQFTQEMLRRFELVTQQVSREMRELQAETRAGRDILLEARDETRAQSGALFALVDELRQHGLGGRG